MTGVERDFLGWERPLLHSVVEALSDAAPERDRLDLSGILLVLPGSQARRRLGELLVERSARSGRPLRPPVLEGIGGLPECLYRPRRSAPGPLASRRAWTLALEGLGDRIDVLLPGAAAERGRVSASLVGAVRLLDAQVGAAGVGFEEVAGLCGEPGDKERWRVLAEAQTAYRALLAAGDYGDPTAERLDALADGRVAPGGQVWVAGAPELPLLVRRFLEAAAARTRVRILVGAPQSRSEYFDDLGCVVPSAWIGGEVEIAEDAIVVGAGPADQAEAVVGRMAAFDGRVPAEDITVGVPDPGVIPFLVERLGEEGIAARDVAGRPFETSGSYRLLRALERYLRGPSAGALGALLRHPGLERAVHLRRTVEHARPIDDPTALLDDYQDLHVQATLVADALPMGGEAPNRPLQPAVSSLLGTVDALVEPLRGRKPHAEWVSPVAAVLREIFDTDAGEACFAAGERRALERALGSLLDEARRLPANLDAPVEGWAAVSLFAEELRDLAIPPRADPGAVPLLGWLELALDDAPELIVTGFNEPFVPSSMAAHAFLPHGLRRAIGLPDNEARWARDAWALSTALAVRRSVALVVGRSGVDNDPLLPSRLLFATDARTASERLIRMLDPDAPNDPAPADGSGSSGRVGSSSSMPRDERVGGLGQEEPAAAERSAERSRPVERRTVRARFQLPPEPVIRTQAPPEGINVTAFRALLQDPYRYALEHVLGLRMSEESGHEMGRRLFGTLAHEVLRTFGRSPVAVSGDPSEIRSFLNEALDRETGRRFGARAFSAVGLQVEQLRARLDRFAEWQAGWRREGWVIQATECSPGGAGVPLIVDGEPILLRGTIDRIDRNEHTGRWVVLDYKTGDNATGPRASHRAGVGEEAAWTDLQLPLYRLIARDLRDDGGSPLVPPDRWDDLGLGYVLLPSELKVIGGELAEWSSEELSAAEAAAREAVRVLRTGQFVFDRRHSTIRPGDPRAPLVGAGVLVLEGLDEDASDLAASDAAAADPESSGSAAAHSEGRHDGEEP